MFGPDIAIAVGLYAMFGVLVLAAAANDSAVALSFVLVDGTIELRTAQALVGVATALGAAIVVAPVVPSALAPLAGDPVFRGSGYAALAVLVPAGVVLVGAVLLGLPAAPGALLGAALIGVIVERGSASAVLGPAGIVAIGMLAVPLLCLGLAAGLTRILRAGPAAAARPRDHLQSLLPLQTGLVLVVLVLLAAVLGGVRVGDPLSVVIAVGVALAAGGIGAVWRHQGIRRRPFWVTNDLAGFEAAHQGFGVMAAIATAVLLAGVNVSAIIALTAAFVGHGALYGDALPPTGLLLAGLVLAFAGILLFGHHMATRLVERNRDPAPSQGVSGNLGVLVGATLAAFAGAPLCPSASAGAGLAGSTGNWRAALIWAAGSVLALLLVFGLAFLTSLALRAIVE